MVYTARGESQVANIARGKARVLYLSRDSHQEVILIDAIAILIYRMYTLMLHHHDDIVAGADIQTFIWGSKWNLMFLQCVKHTIKSEA